MGAHMQSSGSDRGSRRRNANRVSLGVDFILLPVIFIFAEGLEYFVPWSLFFFPMNKLSYPSYFVL